MDRSHAVFFIGYSDYTNWEGLAYELSIAM